MNKEQINKLLEACYSEFCEHFDGCLTCPYIEYTIYSEERDYDCKGAYIKDKLKILQE